MSFASYHFLAFLGCVLALHAVLPGRQRNALLLIASYVFYGWWDWRFLSLLLLSSLVDFGCGRLLDPGRPPALAGRRRRLVLLVSVGLNLGILGLFKYLGFFVESLQRLLGGLGWTPSAPLVEIVLPVGISFYTFQTL